MALAEHDGQVIVLKIPMDKFGVHDGSPVVTVAAYLGRPRQWQKWTRAWNAAKRPIRVFHAADCANLRGEFKDWSETDRNELVARLLPTIPAAGVYGCIVGINLREFETAMVGHDDLRKVFGTPYVACFHWAIQLIMNLGAEAGNNERMGFIHEFNDYRREALEAFAWIKQHGNPTNRIVGLQFAEKHDYIPLQAADVLAYEGNKRIRDPDRPERRAWTALGDIFAVQYGRENMADLISRLEMIRNGRLSEIDLGSGWRRAAFSNVAAQASGLRR